MLLFPPRATNMRMINESTPYVAAQILVADEVEKRNPRMIWQETGLHLRDGEERPNDGDVSGS